MNIGRPGIITNVCVSTRRRERERERFLCTSMLEAPLIPRPDWHYWKRAYCTGLIFFAPFSSCSLTFSFKATYSFLLFSYSSIFFFFLCIYTYVYVSFLFFLNIFFCTFPVAQSRQNWFCTAPPLPRISFSLKFNDAKLKERETPRKDFASNEARENRTRGKQKFLLDFSCLQHIFSMNLG